MTNITKQKLSLIGLPGSPYTLKMISLLRYRHIPYKVIWRQPNSVLEELGIEKPKVELLPTFLFVNDDEQIEPMLDSTFIIRRLESQTQHRSVLPSNPALAFIDYLLEDFADEWATKYMFHYRWHFEADADNAGTLLPLGLNLTMPCGQHQQFKHIISERQISRLSVVGSSDITAPTIDASFKRFLLALEAHLSQQPFILGQRPSACDFALHGQLTQLIGFDPTPRSIAHKLAPRVVAWTQIMTDTSGIEPSDDDWNTIDSIPSTLKALLNEVGTVYAPALLANAKALHAGEKEWETTIDNALWSQKTFPYQSKCLTWLNQEFEQLDSDNQASVMQILEGTGCETLILAK